MSELLNKIINYLFKKRVIKLKTIAHREKRFVNYQSAHTIILLFESDYMERNTEIRQLIQLLHADGKKVMAWGYLQKKEITSPILPDFRILHQKNADFSGYPSVEFRRELEELNFDLLLDLTVNEIKPLQYIALFANAACKVSTHPYPAIFDILIDASEIKQKNELNEKETTAIELCDQIFFYLKNIQTVD